MFSCPSSCCVVVYKEMPTCSPVPVWDMSTFSHPGGPALVQGFFGTNGSHCGTVRTNWRHLNPAHAHADPEVGESFGGAVKAGEYTPPSCHVPPSPPPPPSLQLPPPSPSPPAFSCPSSCCVVVYKEMPTCSPVPVWDMSTFSHPGGPALVQGFFGANGSHCGTVRTNWRHLNPAHAHADPEVGESFGGAVKAGEYTPPSCHVPPSPPPPPPLQLPPPSPSPPAFSCPSSCCVVVYKEMPTCSPVPVWDMSTFSHPGGPALVQGFFGTNGSHCGTVRTNWRQLNPAHANADPEVGESFGGAVKAGEYTPPSCHVPPSPPPPPPLQLPPPSPSPPAFSCPSSCCVVVYKEMPTCSPVPVWDMSTFSHPGGPALVQGFFGANGSHCGTVRTNWRHLNPAHAHADPEVGESFGGAVKAGEYTPPSCHVPPSPPPPPSLQLPPPSPSPPAFSCPSSCCVVVYKEMPTCSPVPVWDMSTFSHPGGPALVQGFFGANGSHCGTVRTNWRHLNPAHAHADPEVGESFGGAVKAGEYTPPSCHRHPSPPPPPPAPPHPPLASPPPPASPRACTPSSLVDDEGTPYTCMQTVTQSLSLHWTLASFGARMAVRAEAPASSYVALGFSKDGVMASSDAVIGWATAQGSSVHLYKLTETATLVPHPPEVLLSGSVVAEDGALVLRLQRKLKGLQVDLTDSVNNLLWAVGSVQDGAPQYHSSRGAFRVNLSGGEAGKLAAPLVVKLKLLHGVLMAFGWGFMLPAGAIIARFYKRLGPLWFTLHKLLQVGGLLVVVGSWAIAIAQFAPFGLTNESMAHFVLGNIVTALGVLQPINALLRPHHGARFRSEWEVLHKLSGWLSLALAIPTIVIGILLLGTQADDFFPGVEMGCFIAYGGVTFLLCAAAIAAIAAPKQPARVDVSEAQPSQPAASSQNDKEQLLLAAE
ncbi:hypothetical protein AB1Y20_014456 [Prymnesium parvum]|uniref:Cytochrome b561 domain-containing protein n=1 Tax=Prymnesium parvum TaxID=97485 RepID=A0AB34IFX9_PRYPA